jgi:hypothetical protein
MYYSRYSRYMENLGGYYSIMAKVKIDIGMGAYKNVSELSTKDGVSPVLVDGYKNELGSDILRPGLKLFCDTNSGGGVDGIYWSKVLRKLFAISNGKSYTISGGGTATDITNSNSMELASPGTFTEDGTRVFMANGGRIAYTTGGDTTFITDADAPTLCNSLTYLDGYILASHGEASVRWCDTGDYSTWGTLSLFTPETHYDKLKALRSTWREVLCFGADTVDTYYNDGVSPFARLSGGFVQMGCIAGDSVVAIDNTWYWLNQDRQVVLLSGRTPQVISTPYSKEIQSYTSVEDAKAFSMKIAGKDFYVINFPSEDVTLVYDVMLKTWCQWGYWNRITGSYNRAKMSCHTYVPDWNMHLVGDYLSGKIYEVSPDYYNDDGREIRFLRRTGHIDGGTFGRKTMHTLIAKTKRGEGCGYTLQYDSGGTYEVQVGDTIIGATSAAQGIVADVTLSSGTWAGGDAVGVFTITHVSGAFQNNENLNVGVNSNVATVNGTLRFSGTQEPQMMVRFRDDNKEWKNERWISLGASGDNEHVTRLTRCGQFKTRQIEIIHTDDSPFELANPLEADIEVNE